MAHQMNSCEVLKVSMWKGLQKITKWQKSWKIRILKSIFFVLGKFQCNLFRFLLWHDYDIFLKCTSFVF